MKIAFLIQDVTTHGGTERTTCCLASEMARHGHEVSIVSVFHNEGVTDYALDERVRVETLMDVSYGLELSPVLRLWRIVQALWRVRRCEFLGNAEVIISQKWLASMWCLLAGLAGKTIACEHFRYAMYHPWLRWLRDRSYRAMRCLVVLTERDREQFMLAGVKRVSVVANMVSVEPLPYVGAGSRRIVSVGRLSAQKGYDLLLEALAGVRERLNGWQVDIYGEGEDYAQLMAARDRLGLSEIVRFCGYTDKIEQVYAGAAFYVMSSRFEGFPMVLLEAAAAGLPIVSFDCPEGPGVLLRAGGGLLVTAEDTAALGEAIARMAEDEALRKRCHAESEQVVAPYLPERIYEEWEKLIM